MGHSSPLDLWTEERLEAAEKVCEAAAKFEGWDAMLDAINAWEEAKK